MFGGWMSPISIFIALLSLMLSVEAQPDDDFRIYVKHPFKFKKSNSQSKEIAGDVLTGVGFAVTFISAVATGQPVVVIVGAIITYAAKVLTTEDGDDSYEECEAKLKACPAQRATCVAREDWKGANICCGDGYEWICYTNWKKDRIEKEELKEKDRQAVVKFVYDKLHCEPEKECPSCGNKYACVESSSTYDATACCEKGTIMKCCVTTTTTSTTTTTATTTTTDENLRCKKAFYESHPTEGDKYTETLDQACDRNERYCYVLNCTTVLPSIEGYIGFKAEWGCSASKTSFKDDFEKGKGRVASGRFSNSICASFVGAKYSDNSNHDQNAPISNSNVSTLWCEGGHFWEEGHHGKTITVCSKHEHYCYVLNCTLELSGKVDSLQPEHNVLTQWGCTDKKPAELSLDTEIIAETAAGRLIAHTCSRYVGKANVSRTNAGITVPTPVKDCKKAFLSKLRAYNESSDQLCGQSQRYCYVLNCSTAVEGGNQPEIMTEWGCTDSLYKTADFRQGKGRQLGEAYSVGPIPNNSVCRSYVGISSNVGIMLPILISTSNSTNSTFKCKRSRATSDGVTDDHEECPAGENVCYALFCSSMKEWGCTSTEATKCQQKIAEFNLNSNKKEECHCYFGSPDRLLTLETAMKMKSSVIHHIDKRSLNSSASALLMSRSINHCQYVLVALLTSCVYLFRNVYSTV